MTSGDADESLSRRGFLTAVSGGTAVAVGAGGAAAQTDGDETTPEGGGSGESPTEEVIVGPGGELVFDPDELEITPGTTVKWVWDSDNHNIVVDEQPGGADWGGTEGGAATTYDTGHSTEFTFETEGTYEYACEPHRSAGMLGTVVVTQNAGAEGGAAGLPGNTKTMGVTLAAAMLGTLSFAYFFLKYGGDYNLPE